MELYIYTDGSCRGNGSENAVGAWGFVALDEYMCVEKEYAEVEHNTTNQRMEIRAVIAGCEWGKRNVWKSEDDEIHIYTDSAYIHNCHDQKWYINWQKNGWKNSKKEPVANKDLWEQLIPYFEDSQIYFHKVKGHNDDKWNCYIDKKVQQLSMEAK